MPVTAIEIIAGLVLGVIMLAIIYWPAICAWVRSRPPMTQHQYDCMTAQAGVMPLTTCVGAATMSTQFMPVRPVAPLECPQCRALWLMWPKEQSGMPYDTLNLRGGASCSYCETATATDLRPLGKAPPQVV
jgi:hypothetical protein